MTPRPFVFLAAPRRGALRRPPQSPPSAVRVAWRDVAPVHGALRTLGVAEASFDPYVAGVNNDNVRRVREGDLDHLVYYLLPSTRISSAPPIEPAIGRAASG